MNTIRKLIYRPKKSDTSYLAQFYYADEQLNMIATELDSFDGRKDPDRCTALVNQLRHSQDEVLAIIDKVMAAAVPERLRAARDYRVKFPDDVLHESLAGQLWFGAECLAAGSSIMNREVESASMRPLARSLTRHLDSLRSLLREQCFRNQNIYTEKICESLIEFDKIFAEFELSYVSAMVPVKTMREYDLLQDVTVLFCETVQRALRIGLLKQDMIDAYEPALMFTIPRLAIVCGLLIYPEGPINPDMDPLNMCEMFRPFQTLLYKIRELLWTLTEVELRTLETALCTTVDDPDHSSAMLANFSGATEPIIPSAALHSDDQYYDDVSDTEPSNSMVHSESTMTIVAARNLNSDDEKAISTDGEGFSTSGFETVRHLQHSMSWPQPADSQRNSPATYSNVDVVSSALSSSAIAFYGSHEFNFSLPYNTSTDQLQAGGESQPLAWQNTASAHNRIIYLPTGTLTEAGSGRTDDAAQCQQVAFVTDEFRRLFGSDVGDDVDAVSNSENLLNVSRNCEQTGCRAVTGNASTAERGGIEAVECICVEPLPNDSISSTRPSSTNIVTAFPSHNPVNQPQSSINNSGSCISTSKHNGGGEQERRGIKLGTSRSSNHQSSANGMAKSSDLSALNSQSVSKSTGKRRNGKRGYRSGFPCALAQSWNGVEVSNATATTTGINASLELGWDHDSCCSSDTSSYSSESRDDEEIALAIQAAEAAARHEARSRFKSTADLIHRLFVCISGVADQLQTNYATDLRHILKSVFECNTSESISRLEEAEETSDVVGSGPTERDRRLSSDGRDPVTAVNDNVHNSRRLRSRVSEPPNWIPDSESDVCMACHAVFTFVKRRHHCRNCGKLFCAHCSSNAVPLPHFGHEKPVRVCNHCFVFHVTPFTMNTRRVETTTAPTAQVH